MLLRHICNFIFHVFFTHAFDHLQDHFTLDVIDLGYAKHKPTWINTTSSGTELLNYNNIRYAESPTGWKRFRKPQIPPPYQHNIQDGNRSSWETDCISSAPVGIPFPLLNGSTWGSEDCLFLNVIKPKNAKQGDKLPVLHWVIGSAYAFAGKDWTGLGINTYGLYNRPLNLTDQFIIVTHNYRLGISGWLPKLEADMNGNIGVWDSLAAIEWTKKYIYKFGGDPDNITVIGQSSGAGIITWLLLGQEGNLALPFNQAWISSPALAPRKNIERSRPVFNQILNFTGCKNVECMRQLPESSIREANKYIFDAPNAGGGGAFGAGIGLTPTVDGELLSDLPASAFAAGKFNKNFKKLVIGNTAAEGMGTASDRDMPSRFPSIVRANLPNISNESIATLQSMYSYQRELPEKLAWDYTTDIVFGCSAANIVNAYAEIARRFLLSIPPATHGLDIAYFFFADNTTTPVASIETAFAAESYLLQYMYGKDLLASPKARHAGPISGWEVFGTNHTVANMTVNGFEFGPEDSKTTERCAFINDLLMDPLNGV